MSKNIRTPKGSAGFLNLVRPDTRFDPEGKYKASITLTAEQAKELIETCKELAVDELGAKKAAKAKMPGKENEDGTVTFTFKSKSAPKVVDSKGGLIKTATVEALRIGSGSTIQVKGSAAPYENGANIGVTLYLNEVRVLKVVEFGGGWGDDDDDEDDGYVVGEQAADPAPREEPADEPDGDPDF